MVDWESGATVAEVIVAQGNAVSVQLGDLLSCGTVIDHPDRTRDGLVLVSPTDLWRWSFRAEDADARRELHQQILDWRDHVTRLLEVNAPEFVPDFDSACRELLSPVDLLDRGPGPGAGELDAAAQYVLAALSEQRELVERVLHAQVGNLGDTWLVPDTNALVACPRLSEWAGDGESPATVVLIPQVLRELDDMKQADHKPSLSASATTVLNQVEEFARRGDTFTSVPIAGSLRFREIAVDADAGRSLSWLRPGHADDQILASVLDLSWRFPNTRVVLVTRDRPLRNKARMARVNVHPGPPPTSRGEQQSGRRQRPIVRVKSARTQSETLPSIFAGGPEVKGSVLYVELVNAGEASAFRLALDIELLLSRASGSRQFVGRTDLPVLEVSGTTILRFPSHFPGWPAVEAADVVVSGTCFDATGRQVEVVADDAASGS